MEINKVLVLLSGGLDSAVNLACAAQKYNEITTLTFDYMQKARERELNSARLLSEHFQANHIALDLPWLGEITNSALVSGKPIPKLKLTELDDKTITRESARSVWVPNRNGLFLNIAASLCEAWNIKKILIGFNREEGATFPDNTTEFAQAMTHAFRFSTLSKVEVSSFTFALNKREIVELAKDLELPFELIWSCYQGERIPCGDCESCLRLQRAMEEAL